MIREVQRFGLAPHMMELNREGSGGNKSQDREQPYFRSHRRLLVLPLDHLVMLAAAQVVSQFLVVGLGSSMFRCVALKDKHLSEAHRMLSNWFNLNYQVFTSSAVTKKQLLHVSKKEQQSNSL